MWEVKQIYMKLIGVDWLSPAQEFEFENWYNNYYKSEYGIRIKEGDIK